MNFGLFCILFCLYILCNMRNSFFFFLDSSFSSGFGHKLKIGVSDDFKVTTQTAKAIKYKDWRLARRKYQVIIRDSWLDLNCNHVTSIWFVWVIFKRTDLQVHMALQMRFVLLRKRNRAEEKLEESRDFRSNSGQIAWNETGRGPWCCQDWAGRPRNPRKSGTIKTCQPGV